MNLSLTSTRTRMRYFRNLHILLAACLVLVLACPAASSTDPKGKQRKGGSVQEYRKVSPIKGARNIKIHPVPPETGIASGLVMAYGHIIPPPYAVEYRGHRLFVNDVQVEPSLVRERERAGATPGKSTQAGPPLRRVEEVERAAQELYRANIKAKPVETVQSDVLQLLTKHPDVFEGPRWTSERTLQARLSGSRVSYLMQFTSSAPRTFSGAEGQRWEEGRSRKGRDSDLKSLKKELELGRAVIFLSAGGRASSGDFRPRVRPVMEEKGLSPEERAERLEKVFGDYEAALDVVENYEPTEWR